MASDVKKKELSRAIRRKLLTGIHIHSFHSLCERRMQGREDSKQQVSCGRINGCGVLMAPTRIRRESKCNKGRKLDSN